MISINEGRVPATAYIELFDLDGNSTTKLERIVPLGRRVRLSLEDADDDLQVGTGAAAGTRQPIVASPSWMEFQQPGIQRGGYLQRGGADHDRTRLDIMD